MKVASILADKGNNVITIKPAETVGTLSRLLREKRIGAAVVSSDGTSVDGVITERDIAYGLAQHGAGLHALAVSALMTKTVVTCGPNDEVALMASTMLARNFRHLPVVKDGQVVGMVSIRDVLKVQVAELQQETALLRVMVNHPEPAQQDR